MAIYLIKNGITKKVSTGFSWKSLLFGLFYTTYRGDLKGAFHQLLLCIFTFGLSWFVIPFYYNKTYIRRLIEDGYLPCDNEARYYLEDKIDYISNVSFDKAKTIEVKAEEVNYNEIESKEIKTIEAKTNTDALEVKPQRKRNVYVHTPKEYNYTFVSFLIVLGMIGFTIVWMKM